MNNSKRIRSRSNSKHNSKKSKLSSRKILSNPKLNRDYGKYGLINFSTSFTKQTEFRLWLNEIKKLNDLKSKDEEKYLREFIQNFNTARLESPKYYDLTKYRAKQNEKQIRVSFLKYEENIDNFIFDDEGRKEQERRLIKELDNKNKLDEIYKSLDQNKIIQMREAQYKGRLMRHHYRTGDQEAAIGIHKEYFAPEKKPPKEKKAIDIEDFIDD